MKRFYILLAVLFYFVPIRADEISTQALELPEEFAPEISVVEPEVEEQATRVDTDDAEVMPAKPRRRGRKRRVAKEKKAPAKKKRARKHMRKCCCG